MGSLESRLDKLEKRRQRGEGKAIARHDAMCTGEDPPRYDEEELLYLYTEDVRLAREPLEENRGADATGQRKMLAEWREDARRRLARAAELGDEWRRAYEDDENYAETEAETWTNN
jgi:hypothetical protein